MAWNKLVKIICPRCGFTWYEPTLRSLLQQVDYMWKQWKNSMTQEQKETVQKMNDPARLEAILREEGRIKMLCEKCLAAITIEAMATYEKG